jgi:glycosyltransferase involved in cell wall biosynthesis
MSARIAHLLSTEPFDLAHVDSLDLSGFLPLLEALPIVCVHHNVESELLLRRSRVARSRLARVYLRFQSLLMNREERYWAPRVALNVAVSLEDAATLQRMVPRARIAVVPNGVDTEAFLPGVGLDTGLVFAGGMNWFPNRDALDFFCEEILPLIREQSAEPPPVKWVGKVDPATQAQYASRYGIELTGYVADIRPVVKDGACYVVPLRVGGGTRLKILDAWAMGKAIVSTSVGCEGLDARDGENMLIRDDPAEFAQGVVQVLRDEVLRRRLEKAGRAVAEQRYSWGVIATAMYAEYERVRYAPARDASAEA